jgi:hypothetical protein
MEVIQLRRVAATLRNTRLTHMLFIDNNDYKARLPQEFCNKHVTARARARSHHTQVGLLVNQRVMETSRSRSRDNSDGATKETHPMMGILNSYVTY